MPHPSQIRSETMCVLGRSAGRMAAGITACDWESGGSNGEAVFQRPSFLHSVLYRLFQC